MPARRKTPSKPKSQRPADAIVSRPFPPSPFDRLQARVERLPVPPWIFYFLAAFVLALLMHILRWLGGSLPPGSLEVNQLTGAVFPVYFFALTHYLNSFARRALANYKPLLDMGDSDYSSLEYTLATMPIRLGLLAILFGALLGAASFFSAPEGWGVRPSFDVLSRLALLIAALAVQSCAMYWIFQTVRQARAIDHIHRLTKAVSIFRRDPVYAFSSLTLRSALGLLLGVYSYLFLSVYLGLAALPTAIDAMAMGFGIALSIAIFVLPLYSMHSRLAAEKHRTLLDLDDRYIRLFGKFIREVDNEKHAELESTSRAIGALTAQRESVERISTWPWRPETLRSLVSTIALPLVLYLLSRLLGRLFGV